MTTTSAPSTARATASGLVTGARSGTICPTEPIGLSTRVASVSRTAARTTLPWRARRCTTWRPMNTMGSVGQIVPLRAPVTSPEAVARAVDGAEVVVNLVGLLAERQSGDFHRVMGEGAGIVARAAADLGAAGLVHISAMRADPPTSPSAYGRAKAEGKAAVLAGFPGAVLKSPSVVFGPGGQVLQPVRRHGTDAAPCMRVIAGATRYSPVYVGDVADAVTVALSGTLVGGMTFELGGPQVFTLRELVAWILERISVRRRLVEVRGLARLFACAGAGPRIAEDPGPVAGAGTEQRGGARDAGAGGGGAGADAGRTDRAEGPAAVSAGWGTEIMRIPRDECRGRT